MNEIEVKILDISPAEIRKKLKKAGAKTVFENRQIEARYYDFPDSSIRRAGDHLRLRKVGKKMEVTFKSLKTRKKYKINDEVDVEVKDFEGMHRAFIMLGLRQTGSYRKKRSRYRIGDFQYDVDKYPGIPAFVEVEVKAKDVKKGKNHLEKAVKLLGYNMADTVAWTGFEVHKHYKKKL